LDDGNGSGGDGSTTVTYDRTPPKVTAPTKTGYTFGGYYTQQNGGGRQYYNVSGDGVNTWQETSVTTLHAQWTPNTYTVTFDVNTGAGSTSNVTATYDQQPPAITPPSPMAGGFIFAGYNTQPDGMGIDYYDAHGAGVGTWQELQNTTLYAQWNYEEPQKDSSGSYYQVSNPGNLLWIGEQINSGNLKAFNLKLTADIVIPSGTWKPIWVPDGNRCTFDGQGHSITLNETYSSGGDGLFGSFNYSTIENLVLKGSITMNTGSDVGVVSGSSYATIIRNVMSLINITNNGTGSTGGLVGVFGGGVNSTIIENSAVYANVSGKGATGGLVGHLWSGNQPCTVRNSVYMGDVSGSPEGVIVGRNGNNYSRSSTLSNIYYCETSGIGTIGDNGKGGTKVTNVDSKTKDEIKSQDTVNILGSSWELKAGAEYPTLRQNP
ncbi:MAG: InlB B-repeat-containing protein, partial [Spirochaetaceae bacterium]|nr:InlB B-repeat-containing protein [Spirochaetaceae bacterium]